MPSTTTKVFQTAPIPTWAATHYHLCRLHQHQIVEEEDDESGGRAQLIWRSLRSFETRGAMFCQHQVARLSLFNAPEDRMYTVQQTKQAHHAIHLQTVV